ncbi:MAG: ABC transporter ATP-binding protein [Eubacteriales bacterium]|nr:ABC transporter ATP-binding protein [Eubacteriales bacterium]
MEKQKAGAFYAFTLARKERAKLHLGLVCAAFASILSFAPYLVVYKILVALLKKGLDFRSCLYWALICLAAAVLQISLDCIAGLATHSAAFNTIYEVKLRVLKHISGFSMAYFQKHSPGQIKTLIFNDIERVEGFLAHSLREVVQALIAPVLTLVWMFYLSWQMALVMLIPLILGLGIPMLIMRKYPDMTEVFNEDIANLNSVANEYVSGMRIIKMCRLSAEKFGRYKLALERYLKTWDAMTKVAAKTLSLANVVLDSALVFTLPIGGWLYLQGKLSTATFLLFLVLTQRFYTSFVSLITLVMQALELGDGMDKIKSLMSKPPLKSGQQRLDPAGSYAVSFRDLSFGYEEGAELALKNINLDLAAGSFTALVGTSGAGKTTLVQLLGRYWEPSSGSIRIGGTEVADLEIENLMELVAFVFQENFLASCSLADNIRMGKESSLEAVRTAARAAQIDDFIMGLSKQYETHVGDAGVKLSGGESQRLAIARAILRDTPIIVFDEASSYADNENEAKIQDALEALLRGKTSIMIAHRLHTIVRADLIVVFDHGEIVEQGRHEELLRRHGKYYEMWQAYNANRLDPIRTDLESKSMKEVSQC